VICWFCSGIWGGDCRVGHAEWRLV